MVPSAIIRLYYTPLRRSIVSFYGVDSPSSALAVPSPVAVVFWPCLVLFFCENRRIRSTCVDALRAL